MKAQISDHSQNRELLEISADEKISFATSFDRRDFEFGHRLAESALFDSDALAWLTREMAKDPADVFFDVGDVRVDQRWNEVPSSELTVEQLFANIERENGWILLRRAEKVPAYRKILDECLAEIEGLCDRDLRPLMAKRRALLFISSPRRISSYHIDRECNCLLQIRGSKEISIFDRDDREVISERELERFWTVDNNAAVYKPALQSRARTYRLTPGRAVHIPVNAPHWVRNGADVSVSLSVNFHYAEDRLADVYRMNHWLRRVGFSPIPPGRSANVDAMKRAAYGLARTGWRTVRRKER